MKKGTFLLLFFFIVFTLHAQTKQELNLHSFIAGKVIDSASGQPLDYAAISLFLAKGKMPVNGSTTDSSGMFSVKDVKAGNYKVIIEYIGYYIHVYSKAF